MGRRACSGSVVVVIERKGGREERKVESWRGCRRLGSGSDDFVIVGHDSGLGSHAAGADLAQSVDRL